MDGWGGERQIGQKLEDIEIKHVERYEFARKYCKGKDVLDVACGCGYGSYILFQEAKSVLGIDYSQEAIDYARKFWLAKNITFRQFDLNSDITPLGTFDVIVSLETVEHLDTPIIQTCQKFYKTLRPGGLLILSHQ
jgi:2-polyprenyl-3-methyl-5-hydroxy-6-metoxy-1,4-benzoquinol methylase